jgi:hypothetical protein
MHACVLLFGGRVCCHAAALSLMPRRAPSQAGWLSGPPTRPAMTLRPPCACERCVAAPSIFANLVTRIGLGLCASCVYIVISVSFIVDLAAHRRQGCQHGLGPIHAWHWDVCSGQLAPKSDFAKLSLSSLPSLSDLASLLSYLLPSPLLPSPLLPSPLLPHRPPSQAPRRLRVRHPRSACRTSRPTFSHEI